MSDWIKWNGGECPVEGDVLVEAKFRDGEESYERKARDWYWDHDGGDIDIIAYRLHEEESSNVELHLIKKMIESWKAEFASIREQLILKGGESSTLEYNLLATEALRLSLCINDATDLLLALADKNAQ